MGSGLRLRSGRPEWAAAAPHALAELFPFLRSHLRPALHHAAPPKHVRTRPATNPPKRILLKTNRPRACQKLIRCQPKRAGISQFQRLITTKLNTNAASAANTTNFKPLNIHFLFIFSSSCFRKLVVDGLEALAQV